MQRPFIGAFLACVFLLPHVARSTPVNPGDAVDDVYVACGEPSAYMKIGETEWFDYDRGRIEAKGDVVVSVHWMTDAEYRVYLEEKQLAERRRAEWAVVQQQMRIRVARQQKMHMTTDPHFLGAPLSEQVDAWRDFARKYPEVDVKDEYREALDRYRDELEKEELRREIADLHRRLDRAEAERERTRYTFKRTVYYPVYTPPRRTVVRRHATACGPVARSRTNPKYGPSLTTISQRPVRTGSKKMVPYYRASPSVYARFSF